MRTACGEPKKLRAMAAAANVVGARLSQDPFCLDTRPRGSVNRGQRSRRGRLVCGRGRSEW
jgi:hypothetical protein